MPNFLSLFTWSFYLPFKYCLKASNYTVCFILRYLILQYTYNISYPNVCHILSEANYHWCRSSFTKDYMTKKYKIRAPTMVKTLTLVFNFVVKRGRERGGGGYVPWFGHSPLWLGRILQEKLGQWGCCSSHIPVFFYLKDLWVNVILFFFNYRSYSSAYAYPPRR